MLPEPDLIDSVLLFNLIKEECSCSSLLAVSPPSAATLRRCFVRGGDSFCCVAADPGCLRASNCHGDGAGVSPPSQPGLPCPYSKGKLSPVLQSMETFKGLKYLSSCNWGVEGGGKPPDLLCCDFSSPGPAPITQVLMHDGWASHCSRGTVGIAQLWGCTKMRGGAGRCLPAVLAVQQMSPACPPPKPRLPESSSFRRFASNSR